MNTELMEYIEDYLEGRINREELDRKAGEMEEVKDLDEKIQWFRDSQTAIEVAGLRDQLKGVLPKAEQKKTKVRRLRSIRTVLAAAASVLIIVVAYWGLNRFQQPGLYSKYEYVDPGLPVLMSQSEQHQLYDALTYYGEGNYAVAEEKLSDIQAQFAGNDTLYYYLGASRLYQGKTEAARQTLQQVLQQEDSGFAERAEWLMVLSALKDKNREQAKALVQKILDNPEHEFFERAEQLQEELN